MGLSYRMVRVLVKRPAIVVTGLVLGVSVGLAQLGPAEPGREPVRVAGGACTWSDTFHLPDVDDDVYALTVFDDGTGPTLVAGGWFRTAGAVKASSVARWDGHCWAALEGPYGEGTPGRVNAFAVFDDGSGPALFAGGLFDSAGGLTASNVARWDSAGWSALAEPGGNGTDGEVFALAVYDDGSGPALYAAGRFDSAGGHLAANIARWDGEGWTSVDTVAGTGADGEVRSLAVADLGSGPALYVGGLFASAGGVTANRIARWDGNAWAALEGPTGNGVSGGAGGPSVLAMASHDDGSGVVLYAAGWFTAAGGIDAANIARWDGSGWSGVIAPSGNGIELWVNALVAVDSGATQGLYAGGNFLSAGGVLANRIARWDGTAWSPLDTGCDDEVKALTTLDLGGGPVLYAGGEFTRAGSAGASFVGSWDGAAWSAVAGPPGDGVNDTVYTMVEHDDGSGPALYAGGEFTAAGGLLARFIGRWDGAAWSAVEGPSKNRIRGAVQALEVYDEGEGPMLFAGGVFNKYTSPQMCNVARWDGTRWTALGGAPDYGTDGYVNTLCAHDDGSGPALYAGGILTSAGGVTVNGVARWDGTAWSALTGPSDAGVSGGVDDLVVFDDGDGPALYAGGFFATAGGVLVNNIARWDGSAWSPLDGPSGVGLDGTAFDLAVFDDGDGPDLYTGGWFTQAGGVAANYIARWDGTGWSALTGPYGNGVDAPVNTLTVHDDGSGPALYAGGIFQIAGGVPVSFVARWDGSAWSPVEGATDLGVDSGVFFLGSHDDGSGPALWGGGWFSHAGGLVSNFFFKRQCTGIFADGFESGNTARWSLSIPE